MELIQKFIQQAQTKTVRIVYPEALDERIIATAVKVMQLKIASPILIGEPEEVAGIANQHGLDIAGIRILSPAGEKEKFEKYAEEYARNRDVKLSIAEKIIGKATSFGGMMVRMGDADGMVTGVATATATVIQYASLTIGFQEGLSTPSSFFIMVIPEFQGEKDKILIFADCAVTVSPDARQLAEIGIASGVNARALLGLEPKIAFLSFSTKGSANHADVDKIREAVSIAREIHPDFQIDGELQGDAALVMRVAQKKAKDSSVAGNANVLIFPDLDAGNICYKLVQYLANAKAYGPILQGFAKPVNDMSRGATVEDLIGVTAITAVQSQKS